jgi:hypothetical protein
MDHRVATDLVDALGLTRVLVGASGAEQNRYAFDASGE